MVFGRNPNIPNVLTDKPPALDVTNVHEVVRRNINAMHVARQKYVQAESSDKIRKALRSKTRTYVDAEYKTGDMVYYRRKNTKGWKGPATVLGKDGKVVMLRHGGSLVRVHPCHLMKDLMSSQSVSQSARKKKAPGSKGAEVSKESDDTTDDDTCTEEADDSAGEDDNDEEEENDEESEDNEENDEEHESSEEEENESEQENDEEHESSEGENAEQNLGENVKDGKITPIRNHYVKYRLKNSREWKCARILSSQPKKTGKYNNWINLKNDGEEPICMDWNNVAKWCEQPYPEFVVLLSTEEEYSQEVVDAKQRELEKLEENNVYKVIPYTGQKTISSRWVMTEKYKDGEKIMKARLVARGYEESSNLRKDSPTCSREGRRMVYMTAATKSWKVQSLDSTSAFLIEEITRNVFI